MGRIIPEEEINREPQDWLTWEAFHTHAQVHPPNGIAGLSRFVDNCPITHTAAFLHPGFGPWSTSLHFVYTPGLCYPQPPWLCDARREVDRHLKGTPITWQEWQGILERCKPEEGNA